MSSEFEGRGERHVLRGGGHRPSRLGAIATKQ